MTDLLLTNAVVFDGLSGDLQEGDVRAVDGRIVELGARLKSRPETQVIDVGGRFLMPGLIDAHVHCHSPDVDIAKGDRLPITAVSHRAHVMLEQSLLRGFTSVRDVGGGDYGLFRAIEIGWVRGPRLFYCGRALSQTGGHGDLTGRGAPLCACGAGYEGHLSRVVDGVEGVRLAARQAFQQGASFIKLLASGGVSSPNDSLHAAQFSDAEILAAVDEAERHGAYVTAHIHPDAALRRGIELGVHCIEHGTMITDATAAFAAERGVAIVPTLSVIHALERFGEELGYPAASMEKLADVRNVALSGVERMHRAGVRVGFGTDLIGQLHRHQWMEFNLRREVLGPLDILRSATSVNADIIGQGETLGRVAPGYLADMIVVDGNPLEDMNSFTEDGRGVPVVVKAGIVEKCLLQ